MQQVTKRFNLSLQKMVKKSLPHEDFSSFRVVGIRGDTVILELYSEIVDTEIVKEDKNESRRIE